MRTRFLAAAVALAMAAPGPSFAQTLTRVSLPGGTGLATPLAPVAAPLAAPSLLLAPASLTPSMPVAPALAPVAAVSVAAAAAKPSLDRAAAQAAKLTPKTGGVQAKSDAAVAFEGTESKPGETTEVAAAESAAPKPLAHAEPSVRTMKTIPPIPQVRPTLGSRLWNLWPQAVSLGAASLAAFLLYKFGSSGSGLMPLLMAGTLVGGGGGNGNGGGASSAAKAAFLAGIRGAAAPGTVISYAKIGEIGAKLGFEPEKSGAVFTALVEDGHLAIRANKDAVYHSFHARADADALKAVKLMNSADPADHARAAYWADKAVAAYETAGDADALAEAKALRGNASLEFAEGMLAAHKQELDSRDSLTQPLMKRVLDAEDVLAWLKPATWQSGKTPAMPEGVHKKLVALLGSLNPAGASGDFADGYIAALDLFERFDPLDFLYEGPARKGSAPGSWTPEPKLVESFSAALGASLQAGVTLTREKMGTLGRERGLDGRQIDAVVAALVARGEVIVMTNGAVIYFDLRRQAADDKDGVWDLHNEAVDAIKLVNSTGVRDHLRAVARLDAVRQRYFDIRKNLDSDAKAYQQILIALANAKLEVASDVLTHAEKTLPATDARLEGIRQARAWLDYAYYSNERRQDADPAALKALNEAVNLGAFREALESKTEPQLTRGVVLVRQFLGGLEDPAGKKKFSPPSSPKDNNPLASLAALKAKMLAIGMPDAIREIVEKEYAALEEMDPRDSEAQKARTYIQWLLDMPWNARTEDNINIALAREALDEDHSGLEKVKERVLEFLALRLKTGSKKGAIIAFTGPPGTGKTSIASAIAKALGRKFVRLSLGGVHDETVLRGHGRTYTGSMPGEIMRQMKNAGVVNPVMLMDEVDKIGRQSNAGDPTAALLEILDPSQNDTYRDRYLDVPYDLSEVLFIVTSNELSNIPEPLRDRMEIIEFDGYTTLEKIAIAQRHIIPQKLKAVGLKPEEAVLSRAAIMRVIEGYTMEAGVRKLREQLESVLRKISAWTETRGEAAPGVVEEDMIAKYLGVERFSPRQTAQNGVGVATGLAVNTYGGSTLNVEVSMEPGTGQLKLRKQFGDDIEDSAKNAYKHVKLHAAKYGLKDFDFTKIDVDINITPAGKVDGPSAGGLMVTAIISALTGRPVAPGVAMTGEITMRGDILPIGGLKQKVMAAHRMGYKEVIFPWANLKDIEDIPKEVRDGIILTPARTYDDIYPRAVVQQP
ncbi:MAG: endopeptidase La [Elusimicrobia bacterium]|nr:endopeptidase La [Elusimicrobiota bacterium]